jgi:hypothetical protein
MPKDQRRAATVAQHASVGRCAVRSLCERLFCGAVMSAERPMFLNAPAHRRAATCACADKQSWTDESRSVREALLRLRAVLLVRWHRHCAWRLLAPVQPGSMSRIMWYVCVRAWRPSDRCRDARRLMRLHAQRKMVADASIHVIERSPVPYGLVRYGVAPDHPEVKNVETTLAGVFPAATFHGCVEIGERAVSLDALRTAFHAVGA